MYPNEILFTDKFLSILKSKGINSIPFKTKEYRDGVRAMRQYFREHEQELNQDVLDIKLLFLNNGVDDFAEAILGANGEEISLKNPRYEEAFIQMTDEKVGLELEDTKLDIPEAFMNQMVNAFCDAAELDIPA